MADIRGKGCDRNGCDVVAENVTQVPVGWIIVIPKTEKPDDKPLEYCSNYCAAYVLLDRYEAESGKRLVRQAKRPNGYKPRKGSNAEASTND